MTFVSALASINLGCALLGSLLSGSLHHGDALGFLTGRFLLSNVLISGSFSLVGGLESLLVLTSEGFSSILSFLHLGSLQLGSLAGGSFLSSSFFSIDFGLLGFETSLFSVLGTCLSIHSLRLFGGDETFSLQPGLFSLLSLEFGSGHTLLSGDPQCLLLLSEFLCSQSSLSLLLSELLRLGLSSLVFCSFSFSCNSGLLLLLSYRLSLSSGLVGSCD